MNTEIKWRKVLQISGAALFLAVLLLGWRFPLLAYCMFLNVAAGIFGAFYSGGHAGCGTLCPRGAFYRLLPNKKRSLPRFLFHGAWSVWFMLPVLAGLLVWIRPGASWTAWGSVFYGMILATTVFGLSGALLFNRGFWCALCPMGRLYQKIMPEKNRLRIGSSCVHCGKCSGRCPLQFNPSEDAAAGVFQNSACMKCGECVEVCPKKALSFRSRE